MFQQAAVTGPCAYALALYTLPPMPSFGCCHSWWCQLGKLTVSTAVPTWEVGVGERGGKGYQSAFMASPEGEEWGLPAQPRPGLGRLQVPGCGFGTISVHRTFLFFSPSPPHTPIFLLKHSLASARFPFGENVPMKVPSAPPSFHLWLCASWALGPLVQHASGRR